VSDVKPDPTQVVLGQFVLAAFQEVGILPPDVYTTGGVTLTLKRDEEPCVLTANVSLVVPLDKFRRALDLVEEQMKRSQGITPAAAGPA
jgi:hypothetical protein